MSALLILVLWMVFIGVFVGVGDWLAQRRNEQARLDLGCSEVQREAERLAGRRYIERDRERAA